MHTSKNKEEPDEEEILLSEDDENELPPNDIVAYSELRSCADIYRMYEDGFLELTPEFQREEVWRVTVKTRFIDSLVKQLPIPSMCIAYDYKTERRQIIDGLQRISSIIRFLGNERWQLSRLDDIDPKISGIWNYEFRTPNTELAGVYRRIQNATLPITVLRCDLNKKSHQSYIFTIFHRLNTGGMKLNNQEIRNCIYQGPFNSLLRELSSETIYQKLLGFNSGDITRFKVEEMLLRFFAFNERVDDYRGRLAAFLNNFMSDYKNADEDQIAAFKSLSRNVAELLANKLPELFEGKRHSLAVVEALLVGISKNASQLLSASKEDVQDAFARMLAHEEFSEERLRGGLASSEKVRGRVNAAVSSFSL